MDEDMKICLEEMGHSIGDLDLEDISELEELAYGYWWNI